MKKLFGGIKLTWLKLIIFAVIAGVYTGIMAFIPAAKDTSFADISISFECWILFGILIIINSRSAIDSALKCFVFFLISQPLVYLVQVPFNIQDWGIFGYYRNWILWTILTFPMGFIGHFMKKDKWWGLCILTPMLLFLGVHYMRFLSETRFSFPHHLLSMTFCAVTMILYPIYIFKTKKIRIAGLVISICIILGMTVWGFVSGHVVYNTTLLISSDSADGVYFDKEYKAYLEDESFGTAEIVYADSIEEYMVNVGFLKTGTTKLILESPTGDRREFNVVIYRDRYDCIPAD